MYVYTYYVSTGSYWPFAFLLVSFALGCLVVNMTMLNYNNLNYEEILINRGLFNFKTNYIIFFTNVSFPKWSILCDSDILRLKHGPDLSWEKNLKELSQQWYFFLQNEMIQAEEQENKTARKGLLIYIL